MKTIRGSRFKIFGVLLAVVAFGVLGESQADAQGYYLGPGQYAPRPIPNPYRASQLFYNSSANRGCYGGSAVRSGTYGGGGNYGRGFATRQPAGAHRYNNNAYNRGPVIVDPRLDPYGYGALPPQFYYAPRR